MSSALTVQPRHLALPDACLVTPSQLSIPRSISKEDFLAVAAKLKALGQAEDFWLADAASFSKKWDDGLQLMAETVGRTKYHLVRVAQIAERFTPAKRFSYTVAHLRALMPFPDEFLDSFLSSAANLNLSVKALRARAEIEFGENPYKPKSPKKRSVPIRTELWSQLSEHAPRKVSALVERICESWLEQHPEASNPPVGSSEAEGKQEPATPRHPETSAATETPRPNYDQRRKAAAKASKDAGLYGPHSTKFKGLKKPKCTCRIRLIWTSCKRPAAHHALRASSFYNREKAEAAAAEYKACHGYTVFPAGCLNCSAYHLYRDPQNKSAPLSQGAE
jgi:hypothetical protein